MIVVSAMPTSSSRAAAFSKTFAASVADIAICWPSAGVSDSDAASTPRASGDETSGGFATPATLTTSVRCAFVSSSGPSSARST